VVRYLDRRFGLTGRGQEIPLEQRKHPVEPVDDRVLLRDDPLYKDTLPSPALGSACGVAAGSWSRRGGRIAARRGSYSGGEF